MVSFVEKEIGLVRIISARQTTNKERADFQQWLAERPQQPPAEPLVFPAPGEWLTLHDARIRLNQLMEEVKASQGGWQDVMQFATLMLESLPGEPLALAEVDYHHGFLQSAISFMSHALNAAPHIASFYHRLADWCREAGNEQGADTIIRLMQQRGVQTNTLA